MKPNIMDRFINAIELVAAVFVGLVAADVFISVLLRYFFSIDIPDSYNFGQLLLGILIFWGIAATSYRGTHITVDLVWANVGPKWQRAIDVFATLVLLFVVTVQTWTLLDKTIEHLRRQPADRGSASSVLALLRAGLGRRRVRRHSDCGAHLPADLPPRSDAQRLSDQADRLRRRR